MHGQRRNGTLPVCWMQVDAVADIMSTAASGNANLLQQCYQSLHAIIGAVDGPCHEAAQVTAEQAEALAGTLKGEA